VASVKVKRLGETKLPSYAHEGDAGMDFYSTEDYVLKPGERHSFETKIAMEIPHGYVGLVWDKSGISRKQGIKILGGVVDSTYRGEIVMSLVNLGQDPYVVKKGDKIAQMLIQPVEHVKIEEVKELNDSARGEKGFGSTGR
jgi:dUTP pyrophosphatase